MAKIDIHDFRRRLELIELAIARMKLPRKSQALILEFRDQMFADSLSLARVVKYLQSLKTLIDIAPCEIQRSKKRDIIRLQADIERAEWSDWTKHDHKLTLRKYLAYCGRKDLAQLIRLPKVHGYKLPEELLEEQEILALLGVATDDQYLAFLFVLWESGCRIGELLSLQRKHIRYDAQGAILIVDGKTGMRRVRLIESAPTLDCWISCRSFKPEDPIFQNTYRAYSKQLKVLAVRAGIDKRVYFHLFRHSRATVLACYLTEAQLCSYMGWTIGSAMPRIYVHLAGHDLDAALARVPTLQTIAQGPCAIRSGRLSVVNGT